MIKTGFFKSGKEDIFFEKWIVQWVSCTTLVLHGAGKSDSSRTFWLRKYLLSIGIPTLAIDFSGHGKSTHRTPLSIEKRIQEASDAIKVLDSEKDLSLCAFSMSGEVSLRIASHISIKNLFLFAPGIYDKEVIWQEFWEYFSESIRRHESWKNHSHYTQLKDYCGNIVLFTPEYDEVIPEWVNEIIMNLAPNAKKERIIIPWAPHMIGKWMNEYPEKIHKIGKNISQYYKK